MSSIREQLLSLFRKSKKDRHRFLVNHLSANIAAQIFSLRTSPSRKWTQIRLAKEARIPQPRIPVYESPDYGAFSLATLKKLAYAFDVGLIIKFVTFDELAKEIANQCPENLRPSTFEDGLAQQQCLAAAKVGVGSLQEGQCDQLVRSPRTLTGIYAAAMSSQQTALVQPMNQRDKERHLVGA